VDRDARNERPAARVGLYSSPSLPRIASQTSWAFSGVATFPVPMAHTGS